MFWVDLERLRRFLHAKEKIHVIYVKLGYILKQYALELGRRWCETGLPPDRSKPRDVLDSKFTALLATLDGSMEFADFSAQLRLNQFVRRMWKNYEAPYWRFRMWRSPRLPWTSSREAGCRSRDQSRMCLRAYVPTM